MSLLQDSNLRRTLQLRKNIALMRQQLSKDYAECVGDGASLEQIWEKLGRAGRELALEDGLIKLTPDVKCIEDWWQYCPDMLKYPMCRGAGEGFINVVQHLLAPDPNKVPSIDFPVLVHEKVWTLYGIPLPGSEPEFPKPAAIRALHDLIVVKRHYFLALVCLYTIAEAVSTLAGPKAFDLDLISKRLSQRGVKSCIQFHDYVDYSNLSAAEQGIQDMAQMRLASYLSEEEKARYEKLVETSLAKPEVVLCHRKTESFPVTQSVKEPSFLSAVLARILADGCCTVLAIARDCQLLDYKKGDPPHKRICGKSLREVGLTFATSNVASDESKSAGAVPPTKSSCGCQEGWLSPRMRLSLQLQSKDASDRVIDVGEDYLPSAGEPFDPSLVYMGKNIPLVSWPTTRRTEYRKFLRGYSFALSVLHSLTNIRTIPTLRAFEAIMKAIENDPELIRFEHRGSLDDYLYFKERGPTLLHVMYNVALQVEEEMVDGSTRKSYGEQLDLLPACDTHDEDFTAVMMMLCTN
ncbi:hypothetical protein P7C70_g7968, partial [Phenoliferia sp. Uapishka_3]